MKKNKDSKKVDICNFYTQDGKLCSTEHKLFNEKDQLIWCCMVCDHNVKKPSSSRQFDIEDIQNLNIFLREDTIEILVLDENENIKKREYEIHETDRIRAYINGQTAPFIDFVAGTSSISSEEALVQGKLNFCNMRLNTSSDQRIVTVRSITKRTKTRTITVTLYDIITLCRYDSEPFRTCNITIEAEQDLIKATYDKTDICLNNMPDSNPFKPLLNAFYDENNNIKDYPDQDVPVRIIEDIVHHTFTDVVTVRARYLTNPITVIDYRREGDDVANVTYNIVSMPDKQRRYTITQEALMGKIERMAMKTTFDNGAYNILFNLPKRKSRM